MTNNLGASGGEVQARPPSVFLGIYTGTEVISDNPPNLIDMTQALASAGMYGGYIRTESCRVDSNRNKIINSFLKETNGDFLFIVDQDMRHHPLSGVILANRNLPIVTGLYFRRDHKGNFCPVAYREDGEGPDWRPGSGGFHNTQYKPITIEVKDFIDKAGLPITDEPLVLADEKGRPLQAGPKVDPLVQIHASGFGCIMLRRDALEALDPPYLIDELGLNGDLVFGKKVKAAGIDYWADLSVICSHAHREWIGLSRFVDYLWRIDSIMREAHPGAYEEDKRHTDDKTWDSFLERFL